MMTASLRSLERKVAAKTVKTSPKVEMKASKGAAAQVWPELKAWPDITRQQGFWDTAVLS